MRKKRNESGRPPAGEARPPRVLVPDLAGHRGSSEEILLRREEVAHLRSRRLRDAEEVIALDGRGARARALLTRSGTAIRVLTFEGSSGLPVSSSPPDFSRFPGEPALRVTLLLACAEPARVEWAVEKGTECGAAAFVLIASARSQRAHIAALRSRLARLARIAAEATKQCDRTVVPVIGEPERAEDFLRREEGRDDGRRPMLLADSRGVPLSREFLPSSLSDSQSRGVLVAIGPEGGFAPSEISLFEEFGALRVSLGPRVLRVETAVVAVMTLLVGAG